MEGRLTPVKTLLSLAGLLALVWSPTIVLAEVLSSRAAATCTPISKPSDLNKIRANLGGNFCLTADIDLAGIANFTPIGLEGERHPFVGTFDGRGHVIRNLKITSDWLAGLFAIVG